MASSVEAQSSGDTQGTSANTTLHHNQHHSQQPDLHQHDTTSAVTASNLPNTYLPHLGSLSHQYTHNYQTAPTTVAFQTHQTQQHHVPYSGLQQNTHLHHQQHHHWDYYARQPPPLQLQQNPQAQQLLQASTPTSNSNSSLSTSNNSNIPVITNGSTSDFSVENQNATNLGNTSISICTNANAGSTSNSNTNDSVNSQTNCSNNNYTRPWEMESKDTNSNSSSNPIQPKSGFEPFSKLPSFSSQFHGFDQLLADGTPIPPTVSSTASANSLKTIAMSPSSISVSSPSTVNIESPLTQLNSLQTTITPSTISFTPLVAPPLPVTSNSFQLHHRPPYTVVPATQVREINPTFTTSVTTGYRSDPMMYQSLTSSYAPRTPTSLLPPSLQSNTQPLALSSLPALNKRENYVSAFDLNTNYNASHMSGTVSITPNTISNPLEMHATASYDGATISSVMDISNSGNSDYHTPHSTHTSTVSQTPPITQAGTPTPSTTTNLKAEKVLNSKARVDARKKERRKSRIHSLESSAESEASAMDLDPSNPGQVDAVSSTANFKSPISSLGKGDSNDGSSEKQSKKKRKRCGECIGCQRKDNCGDCAPCRNDKSHQICKQRRCEKLTEKKVVYGQDGTPIRTESRRGRGKAKSLTCSGTPTAGHKLWSNNNWLLKRNVKKRGEENMASKI